MSIDRASLPVVDIAVEGTATIFRNAIHTAVETQGWLTYVNHNCTVNLIHCLCRDALLPTVSLAFQ
jgi:hypothetical protein